MCQAKMVKGQVHGRDRQGRVTLCGAYTPMTEPVNLQMGSFDVLGEWGRQLHGEGKECP